MLDASTFPQFSPTTRILIPKVGDKVEDYIDRWYSTNVSLPAAVIVPGTEEDIKLAVKYAKDAQLTLLPFSGGHERSIPINENTLCLDMRAFNAISMSESRDAVTLGGGVLSGDLLTALSDVGLYASVPNSNAVGMVGFTTTAGSSVFTSLKGLAFDHLLALRVVTASGKILEISADSKGEEGKLFETFCGAGWGLGIVVSITIRAWPTEELGLEEGKVWVRSVMFIAPAIETAAEVFTKLQAVDDLKLSTTLMFLSAPPNSPHPGAPMILVNCRYFGPSKDADQTAAATLDQVMLLRTMHAVTSSVPLGQINAMAEGANRHGGYKEGYDLYCPEIPAKSIVEAFGCWQRRLVEAVPGSSSSYVVLNARSPAVAAGNDLNKSKHARAMRENATFVQVTTWVESEGAVPGTVRHGQEMMSIFDGEGKLRAKQEMSNELKEEAMRVKKVWDPSGLFWSPLSDGGV